MAEYNPDTSETELESTNKVNNLDDYICTEIERQTKRIDFLEKLLFNDPMAKINQLTLMLTSMIEQNELKDLDMTQTVHLRTVLDAIIKKRQKKMIATVSVGFKDLFVGKPSSPDKDKAEEVQADQSTEKINNPHRDTSVKEGFKQMYKNTVEEVQRKIRNLGHKAGTEKLIDSSSDEFPSIEEESSEEDSQK